MKKNYFQRTPKMLRCLYGMALAVLMLCVGVPAAYAQRTISGNVTDDSSEGLPGVNVVIQGTATGTVTDLNGDYSISVTDGAVLIFSAIGFVPQEISVGSRSVIDVAMAVDVEELEEVIITGYSVDSRRSTPGSVSTIKAEALQAQPSGNVEQQLQGRVAGVTVLTNGQPGTASQVRVRGYGALGGNEPLYIVDGVPTPSIDFLAPDDIASTTVLKDATAASIYGARAAGGVIVYTTRHGKRNQPLQVTYDGMFGVTTPGEGPGILNPAEQAEWTWNAIRNAATNAGTTPEFSHPQYGTGDTPVIPDWLLVGNTSGILGNIDLEAEAANYNNDPLAGSIYLVMQANQSGTDWYDEITRPALLNRHTVGLRGGTDKSSYYVSVGLQEQEGIVKRQKFRRYTFRANSEFDILPNLRLGENIQATYREVRLLQGGGDGLGSADDENLINTAYRMSPIIPVRDVFGGWGGTAAPGFNNPRNPVATIEGDKNDRNFATTTFGNIYLELDVIEGLTARTSFGGEFTAGFNRNYTRRQYENSENNSSFGFSEGSFFATDWVWTNTLTYEKKFGIHRVKALAGQEALNAGNFRSMNGSGLNPFSQSPDFVSLSTVNDRVVNGGHAKGVNFSSYFGKLTYDFNDRYIVDFVVRNDGSSRFGEQNRRGTFPAVSGAWRISAESFMSGITWLDDLKLRGGWGIIGNSNNVDPNNQFSLFGTSLGQSTYDITGSNSSAAEGFFRTRIGNNAAKWERAVTTNIGFDALLFDNKLDIGFEVWRKDTEDLLFQVPVTVQSGFRAAPPSVNIGEMRNQGIDFTIITKGQMPSGIEYEFQVNGGFLDNEIVFLADGVEFLNGNVDYRGIQPIRNAVGNSLSSFYGYEVEGLFRDDADVAGHATQQDAAPGRFKFRDLNGDGEITPEGDRTFLGSPVPDFTGGMNLLLDYKGFELNIYTFLSVGAEIFNVSKLFTHFYPLFPGAAISSDVKDSWTFENRSGTIPVFENASNFSTNTQANDFYVENGTYFRMQNITFAYNLPVGLISNWKMTKLRVFASANNLFTITGYDGLDPTVAGNADTQFGIDRGNFPITRNFTFGVNLGF
ncbi:MAG: TonB-dependent receptor [Bacteroidota bacterium]